MNALRAAATSREIVGDLSGIAAAQFAKIAETPGRRRPNRSTQRPMGAQGGLLADGSKSKRWSTLSRWRANSLLSRFRVPVSITEQYKLGRSRRPCSHSKIFRQTLTDETPSIAVVGSGRKSSEQASHIAMRFASRNVFIAVGKASLRRGFLFRYLICFEKNFEVVQGGWTHDTLTLLLPAGDTSLGRETESDLKPGNI